MPSRVMGEMVVLQSVRFPVVAGEVSPALDNPRVRSKLIYSGVRQHGVVRDLNSNNPSLSDGNVVEE